MSGIFKRVEKKYLLPEKRFEEFMEKLGDRVQLDQYGLHTICNIYYDTKQNDLIRRSIDKPVYKEKFRVRSYGIPTQQDMVFLEIKKKFKGTVYKRRVEMPLSVAEDYLQHGRYPKEYDCQILREIDYMINYYNLAPHLYLAYDRKAYFLTEQPEIRFTMDQHIRSREDNLYLAAGDQGELLFEEDIRLLEIKAPAAVPGWFADIMSQLEVYPSSFSKYGKIYAKEKGADPMPGALKHLIAEEMNACS